MMDDVHFWAEYGLLIVFGGLAIVMIVGAVISVEIELYKNRRKDKSK